MHKVEIEDIERAENKTLHLSFDEEIKELEDCRVKAEIDLKSAGEFIEALGHVSGTIKLECDRCLNKFDYKFEFDIEETFAKNSLLEKYPQDLELQSGQFITDLNGEKEIDIYNLLYQSVILSLPNKKVCGINCNEGLFVSEENMKVHDTRMDIFKTIKISE